MKRKVGIMKISMVSDIFEFKKLILPLIYLGWHCEHTNSEWYIWIKKLILSLVYLGSGYEDINGEW